MLRKMALRIRESMWLRPVIYSVLAFLLALIVIYVDHNGLSQEVVPSFMLTSVDLAQTILGTLSGALLTMTTITFSTIMVVLTTYSSQFSPRTLNNFVEDPLTMRVLGIFMGGFVYSVLSLLFMSENWYESEVISASIGVVIAFICLGVFAYFIHNVATSIQVSTLIREITEGSMKVIKRQEEILESKFTNVIDDRKDANFTYECVRDVKCRGYGYVQLTDYNGLLKYASQHKIGVEANFLNGDFLTDDSIAFRVHHSGELDEDINGVLNQYLKLGKERSSIQDPEFALQKIVEVALRAISPAVNDPNTARVCISYLGMALSHLCRIRSNGRYIAYYDEEMQPRIIGKQKRTMDILYLSFYQIIHYGSEDFSILIALIEAYLLIGRSADDSLKKSIWELYIYNMEKFNKDELKGLDQLYLNEKKQELSTVLGIAL
ncbi:DUF2254 domain-containing protein [Mesobacillus sp. AQ2]|uniref:DUF2254 domain-containing protein n=1 Tax=Bacillaceae TaxID=186817 RepID=UPI00119FA022|nr:MULTISPECIES: DUF2254 domain-containing protein [Bacillaceae]MCM3124644.1 DUF2254 domain-containing protein [Mesobacillus sp. MER 33]MCM3234646.1 DUF2254 domain-containing protein [Mesobacillus sp. MER 48]WHX41583.1 DUF2254 domain-containing protein [Mesobacillus sp. AQ2]